MTYAKALKKTQCEDVETTICKRHLLLFTGAAQRTNNERLTRRVMFGTMAGGENPGPGRPEKNWAQCLVDDLRVFRATEGPTESVPLVFGVETEQLWPTVPKRVGSGTSGSRRSGGMFHDEVAQGRGGEQLVTPPNRGRQE